MNPWNETLTTQKLPPLQYGIYLCEIEYNQEFIRREECRARYYGQVHANTLWRET